MIEINKNPSPRELRWFGVLFLAFSGVLGAVVIWRFGAMRVSTWIWGVGAGVTLVYYVVPPLRRSVYLAWMYLTYPIGWVVTNLILAAVYFLLLTPIGLVRRARGHDPLTRRIDRDASTYWIEHRPDADPKRYFRQF